MNQLYDKHQEDVQNFFEAVKSSRIEGTGVSIKEMAECFKEYFDEAELGLLIRELQK